jgi:hypothetical protein
MTKLTMSHVRSRVLGHLNIDGVEDGNNYFLHSLDKAVTSNLCQASPSPVRNKRQMY